MTVTLAPTLATLSPPESLVLMLAALLPPDRVPLPWLRAVASATFPDLGQDAPPGYDDPWLVAGQPPDQPAAAPGRRAAPTTGGRPGSAASTGWCRRWSRRVADDLATRERALLDHIRDRAEFLWDGWVQHEHRWELAPLTACADHWLERDGDDGPWLAN